MNKSAPCWIALLFLLFTSVVYAEDVGFDVDALYAGGVERYELDNGLIVLFKSYSGLDKIAVESFYRAGFFHEPEGKPHLSHVVEHMVAYSGSKSYAPREAFQTLNEAGLGNAETLASFVHYDYLVPPDQLEMALKVESERLTSVEFSTDIMAEEVGRCLQEIDFAQNSPQGGLVKFGLMGLNQVARYGAERASVYNGAYKLTVEDVRAYHGERYAPNNAILAIVGDFDATEAKALVESYFGSIPRRDLPSDAGWKLESDVRVDWDLGSDAIYLVFPASDLTEDERIVLTMFGEVLAGTLRGSADLNAMAKVSFCSSLFYPVGDAPFFAYAEAKDGQKIDAVKDALVAVFQQARSSFNEMMFKQLRMNLSTFMRQSVFDQQVPPNTPQEMLLGQEAINICLKELLRNGVKPARFQSNVDIISAARAALIVTERLSDEAKREVTFEVAAWSW